jgi:hypothetical protein
MAASQEHREKNNLPLSGKHKPTGKKNPAAYFQPHIFVLIKANPSHKKRSGRDPIQRESNPGRR